MKYLLVFCGIFWAVLMACGDGKWQKGEDGKWLFQQFSDGRLSSESQHASRGNRVIDGYEKIYHANGQLQHYCEYVNGKRHGNDTLYYEDGALQQSGSFRDGLEHGRFTVFYPDEKKQAETHYAEGMMLGSRIAYGKDGLPNMYYYYSSPNVRAYEAPMTGVGKLDEKQKKGYEVVVNALSKDAPETGSPFALLVGTINPPGYIASATVEIKDPDGTVAELFEYPVEALPKELSFTPASAGAYNYVARLRLESVAGTGSAKLFEVPGRFVVK